MITLPISLQNIKKKNFLADPVFQSTKGNLVTENRARKGDFKVFNSKSKRIYNLFCFVLLKEGKNLYNSTGY